MALETNLSAPATPVSAAEALEPRSPVLANQCSLRASQVHLESMRNPAEFRALGGHAKDFSTLEDGSIRKTVNKREYDFYKDYREQFAGLIPQCLELYEQEGRRSIRMENLSQDMGHQPKSIDIKIGFTSFCPWDLEYQQGIAGEKLANKIAQRQAADAEYGSSQRGYRVVNYTGSRECANQSEGRRARAKQPLQQTLNEFFHEQPDAAKAALAQLDDLIATLKQPQFDRFGFVGTSLLLVFNPDAPSVSSVKARLIDFAHAIVTSAEEQDLVKLEAKNNIRDGFIRGLENLALHLRQAPESPGHVENLVAANAWPIDPPSVRQFLSQNYSQLSPFRHSDIELIKGLSSSSEGLNWLARAGLMSAAAIEALFDQSDYSKFADLSELGRLELACFAWHSKDPVCQYSKASIEGFKNPAYLLGRAIHAQYDPEALKAMNSDLLEVWQATFSCPALETSQDICSEVIAQHTRSLGILARTMVLIAQHLEVSDASRHFAPYSDGPFFRALSHGGRVNFIIPRASANQRDEFVEKIGLVIDGEPNRAAGVSRRNYATHRAYFSAEKNKVVERGGVLYSVSNTVLGGFSLFGLDIAVGGLGSKNWNGQKIVNDGCFGHLYFGYMPPTSSCEGILQVGLETAAPGKKNSFGNSHSITSSEKRSSVLSAVGGAKLNKIGVKWSKNNHHARQVDLRPVSVPEYNDKDAIQELLRHLKNSC